MEKIGIGRITLKKQTRANVLKIIKNEGPISRVDIAARLGLTRAAITIISDDLISAGLISEIGSNIREGKKAQGRRKVLLDINANFKFAFGIFVNSNHISMGLSTLCGDSLDKINYELKPGEYTLNGFVDMVKNTFNQLLTGNYLEQEKIIGIGVGCDDSFADAIGIDPTNCQSIIAKALHEAMDMPVCIEYANLTLALANIYFPEKHDDIVVSDAIFLQCSKRFGMIEFSSANNSIDMKNDWTYIDDYVINFNGRKCEGCVQGSLSAEISYDAVRQKISEQCPEINSEIIEMILQGYNSESVQKAIDTKNECIEMFATFLFNLAQTKKVQKIILHKFHFSDFDYVYLIKYLETKFSESNAASLISKSRINESYSFLGGCAIAVREFFVECGGLDLKVKSK